MTGYQYAVALVVLALVSGFASFPGSSSFGTGGDLVDGRGADDAGVDPVACGHPFVVTWQGRRIRVCAAAKRARVNWLLARAGAGRCSGGGGLSRAIEVGAAVEIDASCGVRPRPLRGGERLRLGLSIDPNTATVADLQALPRVGPVLAGRIVHHRAGRGPFATSEDLLQVKGIGPATLRLLRPHLRLSADTDTDADADADGIASDADDAAARRRRR